MKKKVIPKRRVKKLGKKAEPARMTGISVHPWRACPYGEHWVRTHPFHVPPSKTHPGGSTTTRHQHCARNPSGKDQLYPDEIREIASVVRLKRQATWIEAAEEYKGDLEGLLKGNKKSLKDVAPFLQYLQGVEKCGK